MYSQQHNGQFCKSCSNISQVTTRNGLLHAAPMRQLDSFRCTTQDGAFSCVITTLYHVMLRNQ